MKKRIKVEEKGMGVFKYCETQEISYADDQRRHSTYLKNTGDKSEFLSISSH